MKKILTASLVAILAVTAANADIATTGYVNKQTGVNESGQFVFKGEAQGKTNLAEAVNAVADKVSQLSSDMGDGGAVSEQIETAIGDLDVVAITVDDGKYVKTVSETDGKVSVTTGDLVSVIDANAETSSVAPTTKAVVDYVGDELGGLTNNVDTLSGNLSSLTTRVAGAEGDISAAEGKIAALETNSATKTELSTQNTTLTTAIATAKSEAIADAEAYADGLASNYATAAQGAKADAALPKATYDDFVTTNTTAIATAKSEAIADAKAETQGQIAALDVTDNAVAGSYVSAVSEADGKISVTRAALTPVAKMDVPADCATNLCALVYDNENSTAGNPVLKWEVIAE